MSSFVLARISKGEITNPEVSVVFFSKKYVLNDHLFSGIVQFTDKKRNQLDETFVSVHQSWTTFFCIFSLSWPFQTNFFPASIPKIYGNMHELYIYIYISSLGSYKQQMSNVMTANVKCIVTWLYVTKKEKNIFMAIF